MSFAHKSSATNAAARRRIRRFFKLGWLPRRAAEKPATEHTSPRPRQDTDRFQRLPERVHPRDTGTSYETRPIRDPQGGRDTDRDFLIRYGDDMGDG